jgi:anti-sigma factor RsiW
MKSLLHSLTDSESVLLMYLFDELPEDDRAEVESMLNTDATLHARYDELRESYDFTNQLLNQADKDVQRQSRSVAKAQRQAIMLVNQWKVDQIAARPVPRPASPMRKWLLYPAASIAALLMLSLILWGLFGPPPRIAGESPIADTAEQQEALDRLRDSWAPDDANKPVQVALDTASEEMLVNSLDNSDDLILERSHKNLSEAERQISVLTKLSDDQELR